MDMDSPETIISRIREEVASTDRMVWTVQVTLMDEPSGEPEEDIIDEFAILDPRHGLDEDCATSMLMDLSMTYWIVGVEIQEMYEPSLDYGTDSEYATLWLYLYPSSMVDYQTNITAEVIHEVTHAPVCVLDSDSSIISQ